MLIFFIFYYYCCLQPLKLKLLFIAIIEIEYGDHTAYNVLAINHALHPSPQMRGMQQIFDPAPNVAI